MKIYEATNKRIQELRKERRLSEYALIYQAAMPPSTEYQSRYREHQKDSRRTWRDNQRIL